MLNNPLHAHDPFQFSFGTKPICAKKLFDISDYPFVATSPITASTTITSAMNPVATGMDCDDDFSTGVHINTILSLYLLMSVHQSSTSVRDGHRYEIVR